MDRGWLSGNPEAVGDHSSAARSSRYSVLPRPLVRSVAAAMQKDQEAREPGFLTKRSASVCLLSLLFSQYINSGCWYQVVHSAADVITVYIEPYMSSSYCLNIVFLDIKNSPFVVFN